MPKLLDRHIAAVTGTIVMADGGYRAVSPHEKLMQS